MMLKNLKLEQKLKTTEQELDHCKSLLNGFLNKENVSSNTQPFQVDKNCAEASQEKVSAPRKSEKHVSFADEPPRKTVYDGEIEEEVENKQCIRAKSILKASGAPVSHSPEFAQSEILIENRQSSNESTPEKKSKGLKNVESVKFSTETPNKSEKDLSLDSSSDSSDSSQDSPPSAKNEKSPAEKSPLPSPKNGMISTAEIIFEQAEEEKDTTFEINYNIHEEEKHTPARAQSQAEEPETEDMFSLRRERNSKTYASPIQELFKVPGPRGGTLAPKTVYKPQESVDYLNVLHKSINNKNAMFLSPRFENTPHLENSVKKGRKYYNEDSETILGVSASKNLAKFKPLDLSQYDYSVAKNLQEDLSNNDIKGEIEYDTCEFPNLEEAKMTFESGLGNETANFTMYGDTSELLDMHLPQINDPNSNNLANHSTKYPNFFEEFYVVGVDELSLGSLNQKQVVLRPNLLKNFPDRPEHKERHDVIKDFCFPTGISVEEVDLTSPAQEQKLNEILFNRSIIVENCFLFTINANDYDKGIVYQDEYLNCLAVVMDEITATNHDSTVMSGGAEQDKLYITQKAYCLMFRGNHFKLQYQVLSQLVKVLKHERTLNMQVEGFEFYGKDKMFKEYEVLLPPIFSMISLPPFTEKMQELLEAYMKLKPADFEPEQQLVLPSPCNLGLIAYNFPKDEKHLGISWHGPFFFSKIDFGDFFLLFKAIMLEKSVVFVSEDKNLLSSILNGYRLLLKPFKWCHIFISILPKLLIDYMCAPQPMLLGITNKQEFFEELEEDVCDDKIWVDLDPKDGEITKIHNTFEIPNCSLGGLEDELRSLWAKIDKLNELDLRQSTYQINDEELQICKDIAEAIETAIDRKILYWVRKYKHKVKDELEPEDGYDLCKESVTDHADVVDRDFLNQFVETQMFAYYYDCT